MIVQQVINHAHLYCGIGGGAKGFNKGTAKVGNVEAKFNCIGGIDVDAAACRDFTSQVGTPATPIDLFSREQYIAFVPPPAAAAIAGVCGITLLSAWSGQTFMMGSTPIWVRNVAVALMAATGE